MSDCEVRAMVCKFLLGLLRTSRGAAFGVFGGVFGIVSGRLSESVSPKCMLSSMSNVPGRRLLLNWLNGLSGNGFGAGTGSGALPMFIFFCTNGHFMW